MIRIREEIDLTNSDDEDFTKKRRGGSESCKILDLTGSDSESDVTEDTIPSEERYLAHKYSSTLISSEIFASKVLASDSLEGSRKVIAEARDQVANKMSNNVGFLSYQRKKCIFTAQAAQNGGDRPPTDYCTTLRTCAEEDRLRIKRFREWVWLELCADSEMDEDDIGKKNRKYRFRPRIIVSPTDASSAMKTALDPCELRGNEYRERSKGLEISGSQRKSKITTVNSAKVAPSPQELEDGEVGQQQIHRSNTLNARQASNGYYGRNHRRFHSPYTDYESTWQRHQSDDHDRDRFLIDEGRYGYNGDRSDSRDYQHYYYSSSSSSRPTYSRSGEGQYADRDERRQFTDTYYRG